MKKLGIVVLGLVGGIFLTSLVLAWGPWGAWNDGRYYPGSQQGYVEHSKEIERLKKQISEKQTELSDLYAQKNPDPKKIGQIHREIRDLYQKLNQIYYSNPSAPTGSVSPYPKAYGNHYHGYNCCPWW